MTEFRADLHCHSTCSDGTLSPAELIKLARQSSLQGLSITDHDTTFAYEAAFELAQENEIKLLPGVEFSAHIGETSVHILGYSFLPFHPEIISLCERHVKRRNERNAAILNRLKALGLSINQQDIQGIEHPHSIGRPHIAHALVQKGYVESIQEAFKKYLAEGKPAYVPGTFFKAEETIQVIHQAKGLAVIAHPHLIEKHDVRYRLFELPFDGIECYYGNFTLEQNKRWIEIADRKNWLKTGGSDFHGDIKPMNALGSSAIGEETFNILYEHYLRNL